MAARLEERPPTTTPKRERRRRGWRLPLLSALVVLASSVGAMWLAGRPHQPQADASASTIPNTAKVARQNLVDGEAFDAELGFGEPLSLATHASGTLTSIPVPGSQIARGRALYEVDDLPVVLMYGTMPAYRTLSRGVEGRDVEQLERNLRALGYTGFTVDEEYTYLTARAVKEWQEDLGAAETGTVELGRIVFADGQIRVESMEAHEGDVIAPGAKVLNYTGTQQVVTLELDPADQRFAKRGTRVTVTLPDDSEIAGKVSQATTVIVDGETAEDESQTQLQITIALLTTRAQKAAAEYASAAVHVTFTAETRKGVLAVPVAALVALAEGGYGLEVVEGASTHYVKVKTGMFAQGRVEVTGQGVSEGTVVVMPS